MTTYRTALPQLDDTVMLTDSGIETDVLFNVGRDLPGFAVFPLIDDAEGRAILDAYYRRHLAVAAAHGVGYVLETPSWRSNPDQGAALGYTQDQLDDLDRAGVAFVRHIRDTSPEVTGPMPISGLIGPRGDGYVVGTAMTTQEARDYHAHQIGVLADAGVDLVTVLTINYAAEGAGVALAARDHGVPVVVSVTVETDGRLPDGTALGEALAAIDDASEGYAAYLGINCAHPDHIAPALADGGAWTTRVRAIRANATRLSHAEVDESEVLLDGDPVELAGLYPVLREALPSLTVFGGCCGTDVRHLREIAAVLAPV